MIDPLPIFVYGTLKRGEEREGMWPHMALKVREATTRAALFDLGPYPALGEGEDVTAGELWFIAAEHVEATLAVLDRIEGYNQAGEADLYVRRQVTCEAEGGESHLAQTYFFADAESLTRARRVVPGADGKCRWTARQS